jgi:hypothetical protein
LTTHPQACDILELLEPEGMHRGHANLRRAPRPPLTSKKASEFECSETHSDAITLGDAGVRQRSEPSNSADVGGSPEGGLVADEAVLGRAAEGAAKVK